ncbi:hypothetical protein ABPG75_010348 [Micractinium tetrahymenae]
MGGRISSLLHRKPAPRPAGGEPGAADKDLSSDERIKVVLTADAADHVRLNLQPSSASIPESELLFRVQLQASFSPNKSVHLILLPTSKGAEGELSHDVGDWMGTPRKEGEEAQAAVEEAEAAAHSPRSCSPRSRPGSRLSPHRKLVPASE